MPSSRMFSTEHDISQFFDRLRRQNPQNVDVVKDNACAILRKHFVNGKGIVSLNKLGLYSGIPRTTIQTWNKAINNNAAIPGKRSVENDDGRPLPPGANLPANTAGDHFSRMFSTADDIGQFFEKLKRKHPLNVDVVRDNACAILREQFVNGKVVSLNQLGLYSGIPRTTIQTWNKKIKNEQCSACIIAAESQTQVVPFTTACSFDVNCTPMRRNMLPPPAYLAPIWLLISPSSSPTPLSHLPSASSNPCSKSAAVRAS